MVNKIEVFYSSKKVGTIAKYNNKYLFEYDDKWINEGFSISPFSLPLKKGVFTPKNMVFNGHFGVFDGSLPDSWGNLLMDRFLKKRNISDYDGLYRLSLIGKSGMGALEYVPEKEKVNDDILFDLDVFQLESNNILNDNDSESIDYLYKYGGSSGGARPKAMVTIDGSDWIIKFQSRFDIKDSGLCEYEYAKVCKIIGIDIPEVKLFKSKFNSGYFGIKRFDRVNGKKTHMISAAALLEVDFNSPCLDYLDLFKLTKIVTRDNENDLKQLYLRMCFNVYSHNLDDHLKNFSYLYIESEKNYRLSPAYDMVYSDTYYGEHTTSINHKGKDITLDDLVHVGVNSGLNKEYCIKEANNIEKIVKENLNKYL